MLHVSYLNYQLTFYGYTKGSTEIFQPKEIHSLKQSKLQEWDLNSTCLTK